MDKLKPGRELDALIAEKLFGYVDNRPTGRPGEMYGIMDYTDAGPVWVLDVPQYSTDIAAAWEVVDKVRKQGQYSIQINSWFGSPKELWEIKAYHVSGDAKRSCTTSAAALPHAICLAALKAIGHRSAS